MQRIVQQFIYGHNFADEEDFVDADVHRIHGSGEGSTLLLEAGGWVMSDILPSFNRHFEIEQLLPFAVAELYRD